MNKIEKIQKLFHADRWWGKALLILVIYLLIWFLFYFIFCGLVPKWLFFWWMVYVFLFNSCCFINNYLYPKKN